MPAARAPLKSANTKQTPHGVPNGMSPRAVSKVLLRAQAEAQAGAARANDVWYEEVRFRHICVKNFVHHCFYVNFAAVAFPQRLFPSQLADPKNVPPMAPPIRVRSSMAAIDVGGSHACTTVGESLKCWGE